MGRPEAKTYLTLDGAQFKKELKEAQKQLGDFRKTVGDEAKKMALAMGAAAVGVGVLGVRFDTEMAKVRGASGATAAEFDALTKAARTIGPAMGASAAEAATAEHALIKAGNDVQTTLQALPGVLTLAKASQMDLGASAELLDSIFGRYNITAGESVRVANELYAAAMKSGAGVEGLAGGLQTAAPAATAFRTSFSDAVTVLGVLAKAELTGEQAGMAYKQALIKLTEAQREHSGAIGAALQGWDAHSQGVVGAMQLLDAAGITTGQIMDQLGAKAGPGMAALLNQGTAALAQMSREIAGTNLASAAAAGNIQPWQRLMNTITELGLKVWDVMRGPVNAGIAQITQAIVANYGSIANAAKAVVGAVVEISEKVVEAGKFLAEYGSTIKTVGEIVLVAVGAIWLAVAAQAAWNAVVAVNPIVLLVAGIAAAIGVIVVMVDKLVGWRVVWAWMVGFAKETWNEFVYQLKLGWLEIKLGADIVTRLGQTIKFEFGKAWEIIKTFGSLVGTVFIGIGHAIAHPLDAGKVWDEFKTIFAEGWDSLVETWNSADASWIWTGMLDANGAALDALTAQTEAANAKIRKDTAAAIAEAKKIRAGIGAAGVGGSTAVMPTAPSGVDLNVASGGGIIARLMPQKEIDAATKAMTDFGLAAIDPLQLKLEAAEEWTKKWGETVQAVSGAAWGSMTKDAAKYYTLKKVLDMQGLKMTVNVLKEGYAAWLEVKGQQWAKEAAEAGVKAMGALWSGNLVSAAGFAKTALAYSAMAGGAAIGASLVRGNMDSSGSSSAAGTAADPAGTRNPGRQTTDLTTRTGPETVNNYVSITVDGNVFGDTGMAELVDRYVVPRLNLLARGNLA